MYAIGLGHKLSTIMSAILSASPCLFKPFKPNGISHYQLDQSISVLRVVGWYFSFCIQILIEHSVNKQWRL